MIKLFSTSLAVLSGESLFLVTFSITYSCACASFIFSQWLMAEAILLWAASHMPIMQWKTTRVQEQRNSAAGCPNSHRTTRFARYTIHEVGQLGSSSSVKLMVCIFHKSQSLLPRGLNCPPPSIFFPRQGPKFVRCQPWIWLLFCTSTIKKKQQKTLSQVVLKRDSLYREDLEQWSRYLNPD